MTNDDPIVFGAFRFDITKRKSDSIILPENFIKPKLIIPTEQDVKNILSRKEFDLDKPI